MQLTSENSSLNNSREIEKSPQTANKVQVLESLRVRGEFPGPKDSKGKGEGSRDRSRFCRCIRAIASPRTGEECRFPTYAAIRVLCEGFVHSQPALVYGASFFAYVAVTKLRGFALNAMPTDVSLLALIQVAGRVAGNSFLSKSTRRMSCVDVE